MKKRRLGGVVIALVAAACAGTAAPPGPGAGPSIEEPPANLLPTSDDPPGGGGCGPELSLTRYKVQCSDGDFALLCTKGEPTRKRCTCQRGGRYYWTFGYHCHARLLCETWRCQASE
ncbi:MAG TPA: hypothetical protein VLQ79_02070 [Myxococcaceae bacterium]|nr:hypothetical protein [Myxococcaceae bacterium]